MEKFSVLKKLVVKHKYQLFITYGLFTIETAAGLLRFYLFGEAVNGLANNAYQGLVMLVMVHLIYMLAGTVRHIYDTRTYSSIYTSLVVNLLSKKFKKIEVSRLSAHSTLAREFIDFLEHDLVYVMEAFYNLAGSLIILMLYDRFIVLICLAALLPVIIAGYLYGKKMNWLNKQKNDELEKQVDIISTRSNKLIFQHYGNLRKWQIKISTKEAYNFGFMELVVLGVIAASLLLSKQMHNPEVLAGSLFGIYSYILKFCTGLDTIPYTIQRLSSLNDIAKRIEIEDQQLQNEQDPEQPAILPYRLPDGAPSIKISA